MKNGGKAILLNTAKNFIYPGRLIGVLCTSFERQFSSCVHWVKGIARTTENI